MINPMYEIEDIKGLKFIFSPFKNIETASLGIFIKVGARYEKKSNKGIAHFLEHLLFKGSKSYSYTRIKREIEGRGGSLNGFTSQEFTAYYAHFLKKNLTIALDILLDMVFYPLLKKEDMEKERKVIMEEIKMYNDLPSSRAISILEKLLWKNHPLGEDVIGTYSTIKKINREDLINFKNNYYLPFNMVISISGDFNKETVIRLLKNKIKEKKSVKIRQNNKIPPPLYRSSIIVERKTLQQSHLCVGFRSVSYFSRERFVAELVNVILGANMSSRLFEALREKQALCYDISTDVRKYKDTGAFIIHLGLDKEKIETAIETILRELKRIKDKKVSYKELERAKDFFLGHIIQALERPQGRMFYFAESYLSVGKIYTLREIKKEIEKIDSDRIMKFTNRIFRLNNMCISCVGDIDLDIEKSIKKIITRRDVYL
jgi:predicted Zn-dependent peptidase